MSTDTLLVSIDFTIQVPHFEPYSERATFSVQEADYHIGTPDQNPGQLICGLATTEDSTGYWLQWTAEAIPFSTSTGAVTRPVTLSIEWTDERGKIAARYPTMSDSNLVKEIKWKAEDMQWKYLLFQVGAPPNFILFRVVELGAPGIGEDAILKDIDCAKTTKKEERLLCKLLKKKKKG